MLTETDEDTPDECFLGKVNKKKKKSFFNF